MASENEQKPTLTDEFRSVEDMGKPDWRQTHIVIMDHQHGTMRPKTIADHHAAARYGLGPGVPEEIRIRWDTARNLLLYAWHVFRFYPVAEMHAYATLEAALRKKLGYDETDRRATLAPLMKEAVKKGLLHDEGIENHRRLKEAEAERRELEEHMARKLGWPPPAPAATNPTVDPQAYCMLLAETFPKMRNRYAHGSSSFTWTAGLTFSLCRDLIDQLYPM